MLLLFLFVQSLVACQQNPAESQTTAAASLDFQPFSGFGEISENTASVAANIVFQSADGGETWQDLSAGLPAKLAVGRVYADGNQVYLATEDGLYHRSTALVAPVWAKDFFLGERISDIFPGQNGLYASIYGSNLFKGIPGTGFWNSMDNALRDKTVRSVLEAPDGAVFVGCESGLYKSVDGGKIWNQMLANDGINSLAVSGDALICGVHSGLLRSTDGGEHWAPVLTGHGGAFGIKRTESGLVAITAGGPWREGKQPNRLFTSADGGKTWQPIDAGLPPVRNINSIVQAGKYFFCSTDAGIYRSDVGGKTWELIRPSTSDNETLNLAVSGQKVFAVAVFGC